MSKKYQDTFRCYLIDHHSPPPPIAQFNQIDLSEYETFIDHLNCDSMMFYCKDHWGASYYDTQVPGAFRHQGLDIDLAARVRAILAEKDIEFVAYYCIEYDAGAAENFPAWRVVDPEGEPVVRRDTYAKWPLCCYQTGYRDYCLDQLAEIVTQLQPDALFLDIFGSSLCYCDSCRSKFSQRFGYPLTPPSDQNPGHLEKIRLFLHENEQAFLTDIQTRLKVIDPELAITINFASHYPEAMRKMLDYQFCEPILGDNWYSSAYTWATAQGRYPLLMPGEFSQVYNYPSTAQYVVELSEIAAQGCRVGMYSGSQHCDGSLEMEESIRVGAAFGEIAQFWPQIQGSEPLAYAAIIQSEPSLDARSQDFPQDSILRLKSKSQHLKAILGAMKLCDQQQIPWRLYTEEQFLQTSPAGFGIVLLPDVAILSDALCDRLLADLKAGGTLLATVPDNFSGPGSGSSARQRFWQALGLCKAELSLDYAQNGWGGYLRATESFPAEGLLKLTTPPVSTRWYQLEVEATAERLVELIPPATPVDASHWVNWWSPPPSIAEPAWPGLVRCQIGPGQAYYAAFELFGMASLDDYPYLHDLFGSIVALNQRQPGIRLNLDNDLVRTRFAVKDQQLLVHQISQLPKRVRGTVPAVRAGRLEIDHIWFEQLFATSDLECRQVYPVERPVDIECYENRSMIELPDVTIQQIFAIGPKGKVIG